MGERKMKATVIKSQTASTTKQIYDDPFKASYDGDIIEPPYNLKELKLIGEYSTILQQCVEAYRVNILGFGLVPKYRFDYNSKDTKDDLKTKADEEWTRLEEFIRYLNYDEEAETILGYALEDREKMGNGYIEALRDSLNRPAGIEYVDGQYIRVCKRTVPEEVDYTITENGQLKTIKRWRTFRKYVQMINGKKVYFKEYGDPRPMNLTTGKFDESTPENLLATEIIHFKLGSGTYGIPRWVGHIIHQYGARKAEELNYMYFKQGRHVPAAITVENGMLTEEAYTNLQEYMNGIEGVENAHKFLILEAEGITSEEDTGEEKTAPVKVQIKSLAEILQQDALFLEYDEKSRDKLRSSFRLPPIYTGESKDYNKATADTARKITEEQVFEPERQAITGKLNTLFLSDLEIYNVEASLNGPNFSDPIETAQAIAPLASAGGVAPNDLRDLLGQLLGKDLEALPDEYNVPFQIVLNNLQQGQQANPLISLLKSQAEPNTDLLNIMKDMRDVLEAMQS
ncbi:phage portal protein [Domibacillus iocasae]|uniref:Phage portal protein n=1 Tax=Domibacillus iocasae TaxID=1714016 RepID=A0A1E7DRX4_9BACI|nr:phage portal protein [Domibacillus iocasae]OES45820.1 phage portal protein [Domibacillus iocasae]